MVSRRNFVIFVVLVILQIISLNSVYSKVYDLEHRAFGTINHPVPEKFNEPKSLVRRKRQYDGRPIARLVFRNGKFQVLGPNEE